MFYDMSLKKMKETEKKEKTIRAFRILWVDDWDKNYCPRIEWIFRSLKEVKIAAKALAVFYHRLYHDKIDEEFSYLNEYYVWKRNIFYKQEYIWSAKYFVEQHLHLKWEPDEKDNRTSRKEVL